MSKQNKKAGEVSDAEKEKTDPKKEALSWILTVVLPVVIILLLNAFVGKLVIVHGSSMYPTLHDKDVMIVRTIAYTPADGDIVVVKTDPNGALDGENIVKRVIATAGETVTIDYEANTVSVDGTVLEEPYIYQGDYDPMIGEGVFSVTVPENCIFVMGDNRNNSIDSRSAAVDMVPLDTVMGTDILTVKVGHLLSDREAHG